VTSLRIRELEDSQDVIKAVVDLVSGLEGVVGPSV
jgi:hypothetical protein